MDKGFDTELEVMHNVQKVTPFSTTTSTQTRKYKYSLFLVLLNANQYDFPPTSNSLLCASLSLPFESQQSPQDLIPN